jgi:hypothetical protein
MRTPPIFPVAFVLAALADCGIAAKVNACNDMEASKNLLYYRLHARRAAESNNKCVLRHFFRISTADPAHIVIFPDAAV